MRGDGVRYTNLTRLVGVAMFSLCLLTGPWAFGKRIMAAGYDRPGNDAQQSRSVVLARRGMVATSHPMAAEVGVEVLRNGGTAADAAIAVNAMLGVVEPMSCGIGGDMFVLYWDAKTKTLHGLNASGRAPEAISRDVFTSSQLTEIPKDGPLTWTVPGCVDGWEELRSRFGRKTLADLLQPAIHTAEEGFPVSEVIAESWNAQAPDLAKWPDSAATWLPDGKAPRFGEIFRNPRLAESLRMIGKEGRDAFYKGSIADRISAFSDANGGYLRKVDLEKHQSEWVEPISTDYRGNTVWELPPNGQGLAVLEMLNILESYDLKTMGPNSPDYLHLLIEAKKLAFADRAKYFADPKFGLVPVKNLLSKEYAARQRKRINPNKAATDVPAGDLTITKGDTVYLCVVDSEGNCCSFIQSNFQAFGSKVTPGDVGFVMQNRGSQFALAEDHANRLEPGKRPFHTIIPAMVTRDGAPWLVFGVMGGDMQAQGQVQVLINIIDFGMNVQQAGDAARIYHQGSASPTGTPASPHGGEVAVESGIPNATMRSLGDRGHTIIRSPGSFGGYQAILIDRERGVLHGGTDPRKDGAAVGY
ncbi:Putative gamma-glutamyltransferase YwrD [Caulifigura coniformis]|uniref:Glutathione hydrolase proenzyme n=1 Tax=Caulifigura coniformis TaxID=2527983 RepID=A0A517SEN4_9PLAN|nr:gamma-glutamyltransferase [Caulifigura coniformis]QDT54590.1 Putative gamma-glutamyltransferase YwrD [Caulifigura coniformis]